MRERARSWLNQGADPASGRAAWRPLLLPPAGWARWALALLLVLTFARGALWAATTPSFWGPDEDYHAMYAESIAREGRIVSPERPLYSREYVATLEATDYSVYGAGGIRSFKGDPKAALRRLSRLPESAREPSQVGRGVGVVHPPAYYALTAVADRAALGRALPTRLFWMRLVSALFGALAVYASWLLASVVLRRSLVLPLFAGLIVALQPMLAFLSGLTSNDAPTVAMFTLALALLAYALGRPPVPRQGLWYGAAIAGALAMKSTAWALVPLAVLALGLQGMTYGGWGRVARAGAVALGAFAVLIGWWYVYVRLQYGTFTGEVALTEQPRALLASLTPQAVAPAADSDTLGDYVLWIRAWLADAYKTGWFHYLNFEAPSGRWFYFLPAAAIAVSALGLGGLLWCRRRLWRSQRSALVRQLALLTLAPLTLMLPFLARDVMRKADGLDFLTNAGRFVLPSYPAAVVCALCGLLWLLRREAQALVLTLIGLAAAWFCAYVWRDNYVERYFGEAGFGEQLRRVSFDRATFITPTSLTLLIAATLTTLTALGVLLVVHARRERRDQRAATSP